MPASKDAAAEERYSDFLTNLSPCEGSGLHPTMKDFYDLDGVLTERLTYDDNGTVVKVERFGSIECICSE